VQLDWLVPDLGTAVQKELLDAGVDLAIFKQTAGTDEDLCVIAGGLAFKALIRALHTLAPSLITGYQKQQPPGTQFPPQWEQSDVDCFLVSASTYGNHRNSTIQWTKRVVCSYIQKNEGYIVQSGETTSIFVPGVRAVQITGSHTRYVHALLSNFIYDHNKVAIHMNEVDVVIQVTSDTLRAWNTGVTMASTHTSHTPPPSHRTQKALELGFRVSSPDYDDTEADEDLVLAYAPTPVYQLPPDPNPRIFLREVLRYVSTRPARLYFTDNLEEWDKSLTIGPNTCLQFINSSHLQLNNSDRLSWTHYGNKSLTLPEGWVECVEVVSTGLKINEVAVKQLQTYINNASRTIDFTLCSGVCLWSPWISLQSDFIPGDICKREQYNLPPSYDSKTTSKTELVVWYDASVKIYTQFERACRDFLNVVTTNFNLTRSTTSKICVRHELLTFDDTLSVIRPRSCCIYRNSCDGSTIPSHTIHLHRGDRITAQLTPGMCRHYKADGVVDVCIRWYATSVIIASETNI
jgi:hypothetical protein